MKPPIRPKRFSGKYSEDLWGAINSARTVADLRSALYFVCCRMQELESDIDSPGWDAWAWTKEGKRA